MDAITFTRTVPVAAEADVAVIGGGVAGISCALACARLGARTVLLERGSMLGGNATAGGVANFCGNTVGQGEPFDAILSALEEFHAVAPRRPGKADLIFNHEILAALLPELLRRRGVSFFLHAELAAVEARDGHIDHVIVNGPSGLTAVRARRFVDCTGDGFVALRAGFSVLEDRYEGYSLPMSYMYFVRHVDDGERVCEVAPGWFAPIRSESDLPMTSFWPAGPHADAIKIKVPMFDSTRTDSLTAAEVAARSKMMSVLDYHQRVEGRPFLLDHGSPVIGIREGARIRGDYVLKTDDLRAGRTFDDAVAVGTFYLDGHKPDDDKRTYILDKAALRVPPYQIPLRCLIAADGENLLMAGRCFSAEQLALSSARVMPTCSMMGSAAGVAAALSVREGKDLRALDFRRVQDELLRTGAILDLGRVSEILGGAQKE